MDFFKLLGELLKDYGITATFALASLSIIYLMVKNDGKQTAVQKGFIEAINSNTEATKILTKSVGQTYLNSDNSVILFRSVMADHIQRKLDVIEQILEYNHIEDRQETIMENIESKFKNITLDEKQKLSKFNTSAGDMGDILVDYLDWSVFLPQVYTIVFRDVGKEKKEKIKIKLNDLRTLMDAHANNIIQIIEERGGKN